MCATGLGLLELNLPSFKTVIHNTAVSVSELCAQSYNFIVNYVYKLPRLVIVMYCSAFCLSFFSFDICACYVH